MAEEGTDRIICYDRPQNDNAALLAATLAARNNENQGSPLAAAAAMAAMAGGGLGGGMWNSPMALFALPLMYGMFGGGGFGGFGGFGGGALGGPLMGANTALNATTQASVDALGTQMQSMQTQMQDNHNSDVINGNIAGVKSQLGDMNMGIVGGFANLAQDICGVKSSIIEQGYQSQLATKDQTSTIVMQNQANQNALLNGITQLGFQIERNSCDVKETSTANTQKIIDALSSHWSQEASAKITQLQDEITTMKQTASIAALLQNSAAAAAIKTTATAA